MMSSSMVNAFTVDVEDYFQVAAFEGVIKGSDWQYFPLRVESNTELLLDLLDEHQVKATFFVLGWIAERIPGLTKKICSRGHEIACHGYAHERIYLIGHKRFRADIQRAKRILEDQCGDAVVGYRAPSFSITGKSLWALEILAEEGFLYDSSIFPIHHDLYGIPDAAPYPHDIQLEAGTIKEFPPTTIAVSLFGQRLRLPVSGGGYLRLFPVALIKWAINRVNKHAGQPAVLYLHPWEIDPGQPRISANLKSRFRHYVNLRTTYGKLQALLAGFRFAPMSVVLRIGER